MPYTSDKIRLSCEQDRRRKLTDDQKNEIRRRYSAGLGSLRTLAKEYSVAKSTIHYIVQPERADKMKAYRKEHWRDYRPDNAEWARIMREHRRYKRQLYLAGELTETRNP